MALIITNSASMPDRKTWQSEQDVWHFCCPSWMDGIRTSTDDSPRDWNLQLKVSFVGPLIYFEIAVPVFGNAAMGLLRNIFDMSVGRNNMSLLGYYWPISMESCEWTRLWGFMLPDWWMCESMNHCHIAYQYDLSAFGSYIVSIFKKLKQSKYRVHRYPKNY